MMRKIIKGLIVVTLLLILLDGMGMYALIRYDHLYAFTSVPDIDEPSIGNQLSKMTADEQKKLLEELRKAGLEKLRGETQVVATMQWLGNQVKKVGRFSGRPYDAFLHVRNNDGLTCGGMAELFKESLSVLGVKARYAHLYMSSFDPMNTHVTVEAYVDGDWRIYDPTFQVSYRSQDDPALLSAQDMKEALVKGKFDRVRPMFYGEVAYPARLGTYYMHYMPLYANVLVLHQESLPFWKRLPPMRYFFGPTFYYESSNKNVSTPLYMGLGDLFYFLIMFLLPTLILVCFAFLVTLLAVSRVRNRRRLG